MSGWVMVSAYLWALGSVPTMLALDAEIDAPRRVGWRLLAGVLWPLYLPWLTVRELGRQGRRAWKRWRWRVILATGRVRRRPATGRRA